ncbi:hypothetical protein [Falsibacillus pallidus]|uniref:Uncharacterized protein n=1 Tax=Falsibacillus pallidus TaxID=493781 RepID=A0A370GZD6_9BACI|nr:hypothetical protein [Falsibacillus pallidus]RDI48024.1 hypothetical protein DFR59_101693 [Falsibacillus pallidus]
MKSNYGLMEGRRKNKLFDAIKFKFEAAFTQDQKDEYEFEFSFEEMDMLHSFVDWYVKELDLEAEDQGENVSDNPMFLSLVSVRNQVEKELSIRKPIF